MDCGLQNEKKVEYIHFAARLDWQQMKYMHMECSAVDEICALSVGS